MKKCKIIQFEVIIEGWGPKGAAKHYNGWCDRFKGVRTRIIRGGLRTCVAFGLCLINIYFLFVTFLDRGCLVVLHFCLDFQLIDLCLIFLWTIASILCFLFLFRVLFFILFIYMVMIFHIYWILILYSYFVSKYSIGYNLQHLTFRLVSDHKFIDLIQVVDVSIP